MGKNVMRTSRYSKLLRVLGILAVVVAIAVGVAVLWQDYDRNHESERDAYSLPKALVNLSKSFTSSKETESGDGNETNSSKEESDSIFKMIIGNGEDESEPEEEAQAVPEAAGGITEKGLPANERDFGRTLFVGDYFAYNTPNYAFRDSEFAYVTGYDLNYVLNKKLMNLNGSNVTLSQYIISFDESIDEVYITLTAESISWMDATTFSKKFEAFIGEVQNTLPNKTVYVVSIIPLNEEMAAKHEYTVTNEKIDSINEYIKSIAVEKEFWFVDASGPLKDETGGLSESNTTNGIRLNDAGYAVWKECILTHRAK